MLARHGNAVDDVEVGVERPVEVLLPVRIDEGMAVDARGKPGSVPCVRSVDLVDEVGVPFGVEVRKAHIRLRERELIHGVLRRLYGRTSVRALAHDADLLIGELGIGGGVDVVRIARRLRLVAREVDELVGTLDVLAARDIGCPDRFSGTHALAGDARLIVAGRRTEEEVIPVVLVRLGIAFVKDDFGRPDAAVDGVRLGAACLELQRGSDGFHLHHVLGAVDHEPVGQRRPHIIVTVALGVVEHERVGPGTLVRVHVKELVVKAHRSVRIVLVAGIEVDARTCRRISARARRKPHRGSHQYGGQSAQNFGFFHAISSSISVLLCFAADAGTGFPAPAAYILCADVSL